MRSNNHVSSHARILVADDSETIRMLLSKTLENEGYSVVTTDNGVSAHSIGSDKPVDLAILDHLMPGLLGLEVLDKWKADGLEFPVMMLSGVDEEETVLQSYRKGAIDYVRKPFHMSEVVARVGVALSR